MKRFLNRRQTYQIIQKKCRATTLPELLVVMILSGILFLLLFDGLDLITKYNRMLQNRLALKEELFYSHATLERFLEATDSARLSNENMILLYKAGEVRGTLFFDSCGLCLFFDGMKDTIFTHSIERNFHSQIDTETNIDSISIKNLIGKDTLFLSYKISELNINHTHAVNQ